MTTPNYSVICAHLRAAKAELESHPSKFATATCSENLRKALLILADYEAHHQEHHADEAREAEALAMPKRPTRGEVEEPSK